MLATLSRIVRWTGRYRWRLYAGCLCSFLMTWATAGPVMVAAWVLAQVVSDARGASTLDPAIVWQAGVGIVALVLARFALAYAKNRFQEAIGYEVGQHERLDIGDMLKRVPLGYFSQMKTGDILTTATTELSQLELQGMKMVDLVINGYLNVAAVVVFLFVMDWRCGIIAVAGIAASSAALAQINRVSTRRSPAATVAGEHLAAQIVEYVRGLATAKAYGQGNAAMQPIRSACAESRRARIDVELGFTPANVAHLSLLKLASVALVGMAAVDALSGTIGLWMFLAISLFSFTIFGGMENMNDAAHMLGVLDDIMDRIEALEHAQPIDADGRDIELDEHGIEFRDVSFSYAQDAPGGQRNENAASGCPVLSHVSFEIPQGTTCAIVGPSGAGKTTLANLMARFYDVNAGEVLVGGRNVRELTCDSLLRNLSMVFQSVFLFNATVEDNIAFGRPGATHEQVVEAARRAQADAFIRELPRGYETLVGEGGSALSGGQKQRISIARALLKDAPIVILDEATASVDPENEQLIQQGLTELTRGKTVVVIAHRLATIENADQILVVSGGNIEQRGTHAELLRQGGTYRRFVETRAAAEGWRLGA